MWLRSPNNNNANNFCIVNTDGTANNNNANNSLGLAPISIRWVERRRPNFGQDMTQSRGETFPEAKARNCTLTALHGRSLHGAGSLRTRAPCVGPM